MSAYLPADLRRQVRAHFANCCAYCRTAEELTVAIFEFEHITPRSAGGETIFENICFACPTCNRYKASTHSQPRTVYSLPGSSGTFAGEAYDQPSRSVLPAANQCILETPVCAH